MIKKLSAISFLLLTGYILMLAGKTHIDNKNALMVEKMNDVKINNNIQDNIKSFEKKYVDLALKVKINKMKLSEIEMLKNEYILEENAGKRLKIIEKIEELKNSYKKTILVLEDYKKEINNAIYNLELKKSIENK